MENILEICTDASIRTFPNGRVFGCAGAFSITTKHDKYIVSQDTTNNRSELLAVYTGIKLAQDIMRESNIVYDKIIIYSDSQFAVFGLTKWMDAWMRNRDRFGIMYGSNGLPVKNQELFMMILSYITCNRIKVSIKHCSGHVKATSTKALEKAFRVYVTANGETPTPEHIYKLAIYNDIVDRTSRSILERVYPDDYPIISRDSKLREMAGYANLENYKNFLGD